MTCPRCHGPLVLVVWQSSTVATDKPSVRTEERFERCPACGWQGNFATVERDE